MSLDLDWGVRAASWPSAEVAVKSPSAIYWESGTRKPTPSWLVVAACCHRHLVKSLLLRQAGFKKELVEPQDLSKLGLLRQARGAVTNSWQLTKSDADLGQCFATRWRKA